MRPAVHVDYYDKPAIRKSCAAVARSRPSDEQVGECAAIYSSICVLSTQIFVHQLDHVGPTIFVNVISIDEQGIDAAERLGIVGKTKCAVVFHLTRAAEQSCQRTTSKRAAHADPFHTYRG